MLQLRPLHTRPHLQLRSNFIKKILPLHCRLEFEIEKFREIREKRSNFYVFFQAPPSSMSSVGANSTSVTVSSLSGPSSSQQSDRLSCSSSLGKLSEFFSFLKKVAKKDIFFENEVANKHWVLAEKNLLLSNYHWFDFFNSVLDWEGYKNSSLVFSEFLPQVSLQQADAV